MRRTVVVLLLAALLGGAAGLRLLTSSEPEGAEPGLKRPSTAVTKAGIVLRHRGKKQAEIEADRVEVSADGRTTIFSGQPRVTVYEGDAPRLTVTGGRIRFNRTTQDVRVEGGLRVTTVQGEILTARAASWDPRAQVMDLSGPVEATFPLRRVR